MPKTRTRKVTLPAGHPTREAAAPAYAELLASMTPAQAASMTRAIADFDDGARHRNASRAASTRRRRSAARKHVGT